MNYVVHFSKNSYDNEQKESLESSLFPKKYSLGFFYADQTLNCEQIDVARN